MRSVLGALALLALAGCNSGKDVAQDKAGEGQVLPGSVSDAMLPLDTVTSAPPLEAPGAAMDDAQPGSDVAPVTSATDSPEADSAPAPEPDAT